LLASRPQVLLVLFVAPLLNTDRSVDFPLQMSLTCMEKLDPPTLANFTSNYYLQRDATRNSNFAGVVYLSVGTR